MSEDRTEKQSVTIRQIMLETYGADPRRWPEVSPDAGNDAGAASVETELALAEAQRLDALLDMAPPPVPDAQRIERMVAALARQDDTLSAGYSLPTPRFVILPASALAIAVVLGIFVGQVLPNSTMESAQSMADYYMDSM